MSTTATIIGNLTREPELRITNGGTAMINFSVAVNKNKKGANGEWEKETSYFDCVAFNEVAENVAASFTTGTRVIATGRLQQRSWDDKDTGAKRSKVELVIDDIGPSVRWATASITKTERTDDYVESGNRRNDRPVVDNFNQRNEEPF
jgi:single-strand DNA-binding protein